MLENLVRTTIVTLDQNNFKTTLQQNASVIIDFWAEWCEPCVAFTETYGKVAASEPNVLFAMVNVDHAPEIAQQLNVTQVPCVLCIRERVIIDGQVGQMNAADFAKIIAEWRQFDMSAITEHFDSQSIA